MDRDQIVHKFRRSFNGFNRQDVMMYIARADAAHRGETDALRQELEELRAGRDEQAAAFEKLQGEHGSVAAEEARVRSSLEESTRTLAWTRGELSQAETRLAAAKNELARLQAQVQELEPMAKSYEELKERVAVIDLEAHRQAQAIVEEARTQADQLRQESRQWLDGLLRQYDRLRRSVGEMEEQLRGLEQLSGTLKEGDEAARRLREWGTAEQ